MTAHEGRCVLYTYYRLKYYENPVQRKPHEYRRLVPNRVVKHFFFRLGEAWNFRIAQHLSPPTRKRKVIKRKIKYITN
jgi:hypothetical protein